MTLLLNPNQNPIPVPHASLNQEGVVFGNDIAASSAVDVYVDNLTGSDGNNGLSPEAPFATLLAALDFVPPAWRVGVKIHLAVTGLPYNVDNPTSLFGIRWIMGGGALGANNELTSLAIIGAYQTLISGTVTANDATGTIITSSVPLVPNANEGNFIRFTTGPNAGLGDRRMVVENDASVLNPNNPFSNPISIGDEFVVESPAIEVNLSSAVFFYNARHVGLTGIKFNGGSIGSTENTLLYIQGCEFNGTGLAANHRSRVQSGFLFFNFWLFDDPNNPFPSLNCGTYIHDSGMFCNDAANMNGYFVFRNMTVNFGSLTCGGTFFDPNAKNSFFTIHGSYLEMFGFASYPATFDGCAIEAVDSLNTFGFGGTARLFLDGIEINNGPGSAINVGKNSDITLGLVTGTGNAEYGIRCVLGSKVQINAVFGSGATTVTGTLGDTVLGTQTIPNVQTYAAINAPDGNGVAGISDTYGNRIEVDVL